MRSWRSRVIQYTVLVLDKSPFPVPQPVVDELKVNAYKKEYLPVKGLWELRAALADHTHRHQGIDCKGHDVLIGPGSKELMFFLQLVYNGDLVIPAPSWVSYAPQAQINRPKDKLALHKR